MNVFIAASAVLTLIALLYLGKTRHRHGRYPALHELPGL